MEKSSSDNHPLSGLEEELPGAFPNRASDHSLQADGHQILEMVNSALSPGSNQEPGSSPEIERQPLSPLEVLMKRKADGYEPGSLSDGHKIGLALDPGGYAGVVSLAMAAELAAEGLLDYVDGFYGVSVGNINAMYVATGQFEDGLEVYQDLMPGRFVTGRIPKAHMEVLEDAIKRDRPFRAEKLNPKVPVVIGVTRLENFEPIMIKSNEMEPEEFMRWALRGCHLPFVAGPPPLGEDGYHYSDSTLSWMSSIELAQKDGCTDVVSLSNRLRMDGKATRMAKMATAARGKLVDNFFIRKYDPDVEDERIIAASSSIDEGRYELLIKYKEAIGSHINGTYFTENNVTVERLYPDSMGDLKDMLPGLMTPERKRQIIGAEAGRIGVRKYLEDLNADEEVAA